MKPPRKLNRRSFLGQVAGATAGGALLVLGGKAEAFQTTDNDVGPTRDPASGGRGRSNINDSDPTDQVGNGRGPRHLRCTDADRGANADRAGQGRGYGVTDRDSGSEADAARCGRGPRRQWTSLH